MEMESVQVKIDIKKLGDEVILDRHFKRVDFDVYWNSHGNKIYSDSHPCQTFEDCDLKLVYHKQTAYGDLDWSYIEVFINGVSHGSCNKFKARKTICHIDKPCGWG